MRILVTGVAGFIGSHLAEQLIKEGHKVIGVDCFADYYPREIKESNIKDLRTDKSFDFHEADIQEVNLQNVLQDIDIIFHEAAQAGVRASWGSNFKIYTENNVRATQCLLEAAKNDPGKEKAARSMINLKKNISVPIAAILILNTVANTAGATFAGMYADRVLGSTLVPVFSVLFTLAILLFAEIIPKTLGAVHWRTLWPVIVTPLKILRSALGPAVKIVQKLNELLKNYRKKFN